MVTDVIVLNSFTIRTNHQKHGPLQKKKMSLEIALLVVF